MTVLFRVFGDRKSTENSERKEIASEEEKRKEKEKIIIIEPKE